MVNEIPPIAWDQESFGADASECGEWRDRLTPQSAEDFVSSRSQQALYVADTTTY